MDDQLLVRVYNVGLGDCIYLRVPDGEKEVHILIDCGNKFGSLDLLGSHIAALRDELPDAGGGKKRLDLLVVTHPHEDHHKGFEKEFFEDLKIDRLWLSPAFDRSNPKAQGFHALQAAALRALQGLAETALGGIGEAVSELLGLSKAEAIEMLNTTLPEANGIQPEYVSADTPPEDLALFADPGIRLKVLGPMADIDRFYLGGDGLAAGPSGLNSSDLADGYQALYRPPEGASRRFPETISSQDFNRLTARLRSNALAVAGIAGHAVNNLSVVLLLEWHGRRLLFPGDAEWDGAFGGEVRQGRANGSWNVMWQERKTELSAPLDFLKIGHHGSENATPWTPPDPDTGVEHPINQILDALLPRPGAGQPARGFAVASTERTSRWNTIPDPALMEELGMRVANATTQYVEDPARLHVPSGVKQPRRTDLEAQAAGAPVAFIETRFARE